jgi:type II secretory pathway component GspD/PulD (secretin)
MNATATQLLSSDEFCKLLHDTIPVKSASANVSFYTSNFIIIIMFLKG